MIQLDIFTYWTELILFQILFPVRLLQNIEPRSLCYTIGPCWFSILNKTVCACCLKLPNYAPLPQLLPPGSHKVILSLWVCFCFVNKFMHINFFSECSYNLEQVNCCFAGKSVHRIPYCVILEGQPSTVYLEHLPSGRYYPWNPCQPLLVIWWGFGRSSSRRSIFSRTRTVLGT